MERMIRRWGEISEEVIRKLAKEATPESYLQGYFKDGPYMPAYSEALIGRNFTFVIDDGFATQSYSFLDKTTLVWEADGEKHEDYYVAHESEPGITFVEHYIKDSWPVATRTVIIDEQKGYVTLVHAQLGNESTVYEVSRTFRFGKIAELPQQGEKHGFTRDLIGKAIEWTYKYDDFHVKHIYSSEYYYTYAMLKGDQCWMASNPANFAKINDHLYIFSFLEERQGGHQGLFLMDLEKLHDIGAFFGISGGERIECYTVGAKGEWQKPETCFDEWRASFQ